MEVFTGPFEGDRRRERHSSKHKLLNMRERHIRIGQMFKSKVYLNPYVSSLITSTQYLTITLQICSRKAN